MATNLTNWTSINATAPALLQPGLHTTRGAALLSSGILLAVISPFTIILNGLLLVTIFRDKNKTFRSPSGIFLVGLAFTDLITGLVAEPPILTCYFYYFQHPQPERLCDGIFKYVGLLTIAVNNSSFLIVLAFTIAQYLAVNWPIRYKGAITNCKSIVCIVVIWAYAVLFASLRAFGVSKEFIEMLDLFLHSTLVLLLMMIIYALLHRSFSEKFKRGYVLRAESSMNNEAANNVSSRRQSKHLETERRFVRINLLLILLLLCCTLPNTIVWYLQVFNQDLQRNQDFFIARIAVDNALWLKFMLDPVVYAWRLPKYRLALRNTLTISRK